MIKHKAKRYITILLTIAFCACACSAAVFAESQGQTGPVSHDDSPGLSSASSEQTFSSSLPSSSSFSSSSSDVFIPATIQITLIYDNGTQTEVKTVNVGTKVSQLPVPSRDGYQFAGWTMNGNALPSSEELLTDASLTASWTEIVVSSAAPSSKARVQSSQKPPDAHESEVEALASEAREATSDPGVLSSQDWSELLSSAADPSAPAATESEVSSAADQTTSGGFSWLFVVGVALIVLALGGIGLFVYLQFFSGPRGGGKGPRGGGKKNDDDTVFTDVSSFSSPSQRTAGSGRDPDMEDTIPIGPKGGVSAPPAKRERGPAEPDADDADTVDTFSRMSQAKPVEGRKNDFDWEKFFNEDEDGSEK